MIVTNVKIFVHEETRRVSIMGRVCGPVEHSHATTRIFSIDLSAACTDHQFLCSYLSAWRMIRDSRTIPLRKTWVHQIHALSGDRNLSMISPRPRLEKCGRCWGILRNLQIRCLEEHTTQRAGSPRTWPGKTLSTSNKRGRATHGSRHHAQEIHCWSEWALEVLLEVWDLSWKVL